MRGLCQRRVTAYEIEHCPRGGVVVGGDVLIGNRQRLNFLALEKKLPVPRPAGFTIERVQGDRDYEPGNCVWIAKGDQSKNRRTVRLVRINGQVKTVPDWCAEYGLNYWTAIRRISRGWPPDKAITTPIRGAA